ncbi:sensor histidine kinase, partial [Spirosoma arcticum]
RERELNELKSNFVTLASHEFRTPMGTILSSASLIGRYDGPDDGEKRERHVQRIKSAVQGLTGLLNDFLSLSQMEESTLHGRPQPLHIITFCQEVIDDMQAVIKPHQRVVYTHRSGEPAISLDGQMLKNILINLLVNASKYSADGKEIELTTRVDGDQLWLTVRDEGIGIPDADKDKLFINFFRARNVNHVSGTGLGLYVVKRYVDLLGGMVTFTSQLDSGTVFTVQLPVSPPIP